MRHILFIALLLLGTTWAIAQNGQNQASPSNQGASAQGDMSATNSGGNVTVQGCLSGSEGNYMLTDKNGTAYELTGDTTKLADHVGHEIKVTGSTSAAAGTPSSDSSDTTGASKQSLQVTSFKHVSKTCTSGGGTSH